MTIRTAITVSTIAWRWKAGATVGGPPAEQKPLFARAFTAGEFQARRANVMQAIGDGVAILAGATESEMLDLDPFVDRLRMIKSAADYIFKREL